MPDPRVETAHATRDDPHIQVGALSKVWVGTRHCEVENGSRSGVGHFMGIVETGDNVSAIVARLMPLMYVVRTLMTSTGPHTPNELKPLVNEDAKFER